MRLSLVYFCLLATLASILTSTHAAPTGKTNNYDVCILGSGAAGMSSAVFLKDKGYNVVVLENQDRIGGYCQTEYFDLPPGIPAGSPNWIDLGVQVFDNSTTANDSGNGNWALDTAAFAQRFAAGYSNGSTIPIGISGYGDIYNVSLALGLYYGIRNTTSGPEYADAFTRYYNYVKQFPWLNNAEWPDPIPSELLVPFSQFIVENNFTILGEGLFRDTLTAGGIFDFSQTPTIYALGSTTASILGLYVEEYSLFTMYNGCSTIYNGIQNYLNGSVVTNARVLNADRSNRGVVLSVLLNSTVNQVYNCGKLIVAYPQTLPAVSMLNLDLQEFGVFKNTENFFYYTSEVDLEGPFSFGVAFTIMNVNENNLYGYPNYPGVVMVTRDLPYGPGVAYGGSNNPISNQLQYSIMQAQLDNMPSSLLTNITITLEVPHNIYLAHFPYSVLAASPNIYTRLENLQGHLSTYWLGTLRNYADSAVLWDQSYKVINEHF